jgi:hypothetical protein
VDLCFAIGQFREHSAQAKCLGRQVGPHPVVAGRRGVTLVEDQVQDLEYGGQPRRALVGCGHVEGDASGGESLFGPHNPLRDRRLAGQERASDLGSGQTGDQAQGERGPCLGRQNRVAGDEDEAQDVVVDAASVEHAGELIVAEHRRLLNQSGFGAELLHLALEGLATPEPVDRAVFGGRHQPSARVDRDAFGRPLLEGGDQGVLG